MSNAVMKVVTYSANPTRSRLGLVTVLFGERPS